MCASLQNLLPFGPFGLMRSHFGRFTARRAFSLLELLVVLILLGLVAAIAVPNYQAAIARSEAKVDEQTLAAVSREVVARSLLNNQHMITMGDVVVALEECGACTAAPGRGTHAAGGGWKVVGFDYSTIDAEASPGPVEDPVTGNSGTAGTYGYLHGSGWGTGTVNIVMASTSDGRYVHAHLRVGVIGSITWVDSNPTPIGPPDPDAEPYDPDIPLIVANTGYTGPLTFDSFGDANGLFARIGGAHIDDETYINPVSEGLIGYTGAANVVDVARISNRSGASGSWRIGENVHAIFDLGPDRAVTITDYTINVGSDHQYYRPRNWTIQGSNDAISWDDIDVRVNETSITAADNAWYHFDVNRPAGVGPYRFVRFASTGRGANVASQGFQEVEFYGQLHEPVRVRENLPFTGYGTRHGLFHWIGTQSGTSEYTNPIVLGEVTRVGGSNVLFNRNSGSEWSVKAGGSMVVDIGEHRRFHLTSYTVRSTGHQYYRPRNWNVEGSDSPSGPWTVLDQRVNDPAISATENRYYRLIPNTDISATSYRYFRIVVTGDGAGHASSRFADIEFYGRLTKAP